MRPCYAADPEGVLAWLLEPSIKAGGNRLLKSRICEPDAAASLICRLAVAGETFDAGSLMGIYQHDPALAELGWTREMAFRPAVRTAVIFPDKVAKIAELVPGSRMQSRRSGVFQPNVEC